MGIMERTFRFTLIFMILLCMLAFTAFTIMFGVAVDNADAAQPQPWWSLDQSTMPTYVSTAHKPAGEVVVRAIDVGTGQIEGEAAPVALKDTLPSGVSAVAISGKVQGWFLESGQSVHESHGNVTCTLATLTCSYAEDAAPFSVIEVTIKLNVEPGAKSGLNTVNVSGGGAPAASRSQQITVSELAVPFGVEDESYKLAPEAEGGLPASEAGAHPFQLTTSLAFNNTGEGTFQPAEPRDQNFELPAGLVGDAQATPQCTATQFDTQVGAGNGCPADTTVGVAVVWIFASLGAELSGRQVPVFNLVPTEGEPARFGVFPGAPIPIDTSLRSGSDYGVTASVHNTAQGVGLIATSLTLWGSPGDSVHNSERGWKCIQLTNECVTGAEEAKTALLSMPSACQALSAPMTANSWSDAAFLPQIESSLPLILDSCDHEPFDPAIDVQPTTVHANTPTGLKVHVKVPQESSEQPEGISQADVRNTTVTLPAGLQINPAAAAGLQGCTMSQIGFRELESGTGRPLFIEETEAERLGEEPHKNECPEASRLGKVTVHSKLLPEPLIGYVYQAAQNQNPFGSLLAIYVVAEDKKAGVRVRLPGKVEVQPNGQLISSFRETPQVPFEEFTLEFFEGGQAPLATTGCGTYTTASSIEPWSSAVPGEILAEPSSHFEVTQGVGGGSCAGDPPFAPGFTAGTTNNDGGAFSPMTVTLARKDGEQPLSTVAITMPPGLAGMLSAVQLCAEAQAIVGDCPVASKIGHVRVSAGIGSEPIVLPEAGKPEDPVYLTGPYKGAPFGIAIVVPAEAGPFNLDEGGHPVVVRGKINVNPHTAQVSIESEPMPTRLQGIPLDVRNVEVVIDKSGFTFNPTNCEPMSITGTIGSSEGASEAVSSRFEAADCATLPFKPTFSATTHKGHTRRDGAYLRVQISSGSGQANLKSVRVELPKIMPSRGSTLKQACSEKQFAENPSGCPEGSRVGTAVVHTPVLPVPLTGPAIFVSHGGAGFPDLDLVLQGDGVTVDQTGNTNIVNGITISEFKSVPDVPVSSVELTLPEASNSALTATANLCFQTVTKRVKAKEHGKTVYRKKHVQQKRTLAMPTTITGQNGAVIDQSTTIDVEGCGKAKGSASSARHKGSSAKGHGKKR